MSDFSKYLTIPKSSVSATTPATTTTSTSSSSVETKPSSTLYIGNLGQTSEYNVIQMFQEFGKIKKINYMWHMGGPLKGQPRGYCFLEYEDIQTATEAIKKLHGKRIGPQRRMVVNYATSEQERGGITIGSSALNSNNNSTTTSSSFKKHSNQTSDTSSGGKESSASDSLSSEKNSKGMRCLYGSSKDKIKALERKLEAMKKLSTADSNCIGINQDVNRDRDASDLKSSSHKSDSKRYNPY